MLNTNPYLAITKADGPNHGCGLKIIQDVADVYNGEIDFYEEDGILNVIVRLKTAKSEQSVLVGV